MRQATNREKAAKIAEKDPFGPVDEQLDRSAASEEANAATMAQVQCRYKEVESLHQEKQTCRLCTCMPYSM